MRIKPLLFLATTAGLVAYILLTGAGNIALVREGSQAPPFIVKNLKGLDTSLDQMKGRVVFVNFWESHCGPCVAEMPDLELLAQHFSGRKFEMMPISLDVNSADVARFYRERHLTMPAYLDPHQKVAAKFNITGTPESFVIDAEGKVVKYYFGPMRWTSPQMLATLDSLIPE